MTAKPSWMKTLAPVAATRFLAKSISFFSSPGSKRRFSSKMTLASFGKSSFSPGRGKGRKATLVFNKSCRRSATFCKENLGFSWPSGRPR